MEAGGGAEGRKLGSRMKASPEGGRPAYASSVRSAPARPMRGVQIIYYLCRNGQLEHPHFMELAQHPHQPLRLKDVMDRLMLLRGKGMPTLFSWSCKRNYKNGYVWNDLSENDVIYPSNGVEYVLKGSEIFTGCSSDRLQHLRVTDRCVTKPLALPHSHKQYEDGYRDDAAEDPKDDELGYPYHRQAAVAQIARPDKPVSALTKPAGLPIEETSPPSSTSSDKPPPVQQPSRGDETEPNRTGSMLLQLIACGSATGSEPRRSCGLVNRLTSCASADEEEKAGGELSRRFGHLGVEEKGYFSGSIVESGGRATPLPSSLKRSNSYNERSSRPGVGAIGEERPDEQMEGEDGVRGRRCIPGRKKQQQPKQAPDSDLQVLTHLVLLCKTKPD